MRSGTRAVSVSASKILRRNHSPQSVAAAGAGADFCNAFVASSSRIIKGLSYNFCASHQATGIIDVSCWAAALPEPSRASERRKLAPLTRRCCAASEWHQDSCAGSGLGERDEEGAELDGLEAIGNLDHPETRLAAPAPAEVGLAEDAAVVGVAVHGLVVGNPTAGAELVHGDDEAEAPTGPQDGQDGADGRVHVADVLEDGEGVRQVEVAGSEVLVDLLGQALAE